MGKKPYVELAVGKENGVGYRIGQEADEDHFWRILCECQEFVRVKPGCIGMCSHVRHFLDIGGDAIARINGQEVVMDSQVIVPIVTKPVGVEALARLSDPDEFGIRHVRLVWKVLDIHNSMTTAPGFKWEHRNLGFLPSSLGRKAVRQLIIEYVWSEGEDIAELGCAAPQHSYSYLTDPACNSESPTPQLLADLLNILTTGYCYTCNLDIQPGT